MADAMDDLDRLIERVEAGTATGGDGALAVPVDMSDLIEAVVGADWWSEFVAAHDGSLDAAKALHEALLPGWEAMTRMMMNGGEAVVFEVDEFGTHKIGKHWVCETKSSSPARAWLLAILRAYRTAEGAKP